MQKETYRGRTHHYQALLGEVMNGEHERDVLPNPSYDFAEERQAIYYTNLRWNMESDMGVMVMNHHQQSGELGLIKEWKSNEYKGKS